MKDENILHFTHKTTHQNPANNSHGDTPTASRLSDLKNTLDKRLQLKQEQEQAAELQRRARESHITKTIKKLVTGLSAALLLGGLTSAGWALAQKDNHLIQKDKEKLSLDYSQLKNRNQQLERENASLLAKLQNAEKNAQALDKLSTDLGTAVDQLKTNNTELVVKLDHANASIEQLYKDKATQVNAFKALTQTHQVCEKNTAALNEKINLLQTIFDQGRNVLSQSKSKLTAPAKAKEG